MVAPFCTVLCMRPTLRMDFLVPFALRIGKRAQTSCRWRRSEGLDEVGGVPGAIPQGVSGIWWLERTRAPSMGRCLAGRKVQENCTFVPLRGNLFRGEPTPSVSCLGGPLRKRAHEPSPKRALENSRSPGGHHTLGEDRSKSEVDTHSRFELPVPVKYPVVRRQKGSSECLPWGLQHHRPRFLVRDISFPSWWLQKRAWSGGSGLCATPPKRIAV